MCCDLPEGAQLARANGRLYFDSNGARIAYQIYGDGAPVILVHGLGTPPFVNFTLTGILGKFSRRFKLVAPHLRGHGASQRLYSRDQYGIEMVHDIARLMDHLGLEKAHVVGYSLGGFITLKFGLTYPERLLSFAPCGAGWAPPNSDDIRLADDISEGVRTGRGFYPLLEYLRPPTTPLNRGLNWFVNTGMNIMNDGKALAFLLDSFKQLQVDEEVLRRNAVPSLSVVGGCDPFSKFGENLHAVMPHHDLVVVPKGDHFTTLLYPLFSQSILSFLERNTER